MITFCHYFLFPIFKPKELINILLHASLRSLEIDNIERERKKKRGRKLMPQFAS